MQAAHDRAPAPLALLDEDPEHVRGSRRVPEGLSQAGERREDHLGGRGTVLAQQVLRRPQLRLHVLRGRGAGRGREAHRGPQHLERVVIELELAFDDDERPNEEPVGIDRLQHRLPNAFAIERRDAGERASHDSVWIAARGDGPGARARVVLDRPEDRRVASDLRERAVRIERQIEDRARLRLGGLFVTRDGGHDRGRGRGLLRRGGDGGGRLGLRWRLELGRRLHLRRRLDLRGRLGLAREFRLRRGVELRRRLDLRGQVDLGGRGGRARRRRRRRRGPNRSRLRRDGRGRRR